MLPELVTTDVTNDDRGGIVSPSKNHP